MKNENRKLQDVSNLIYGRNTVIASLKENQVKTIYLQDHFSNKEILSLISEKNIKTIYLPIDEMNKKAKFGNHQGIIAVVKDYQYVSLDEIITEANKKENPLILILDEIEDPHNFGAILRSADAFSVDGIIIKNRNQVNVNSTVAKVSTGAINYVKVAMVSNLVSAINKLKDAGYWVYSSDGSAKDDYSKLDYNGKTVVVMGSEGRGISRLVLDNSDFKIKIPMTGHVNSLNVSVATGIILAMIRSKQ